MKQLILVVSILYSLTTFSQSSTIYDIRPLPPNITQEYVDGSVERHKIKLVKDKKRVNIYVNNHYVTNEKIKTLKEYCRQLIEFTEPNKAYVISLDDSKGKNSNLLGRINGRIDVISIRIIENEKEVFPMVMGVDRLKAIYYGLDNL